MGSGSPRCCLIRFRKCMMCNTKIDNVSGLCKKAKESSCNTTPSPSLSVYGRVCIADASGSTDMMIDEEPLCAFAGVDTVQELADMIDTDGLQSITFGFHLSCQWACSASLFQMNSIVK